VVVVVVVVVVLVVVVVVVVVVGFLSVSITNMNFWQHCTMALCR